MPEVVIFLLIFSGLGAFFLFFHLLLGKLIRPNKPEADKLTIYECGEPTIGSAWVQFDLRYYVVALLFVIFDVEVAFFFPWAIVFGTANNLTENRPPKNAERVALTQQLAVTELPPVTVEERIANKKLDEEGVAPAAARQFALLGFFDILVFFGVLLVGFAYLWKRGDINWVRAMETEETAEPEPPPPQPLAREEALVH